MEEKKLAELRPLPAAVCVEAGESLEQLVRTVLDHPESHDLCVVNEDGGLLGVINIKSIFQTIFFHHTDPKVMVRHLISLVSSEIVGDIMIADPVIAVETETVDDAIRKMIAHDLGELPVVDERKRLLGSISIHTILEAWLQIESEGVEKDNASTSESQLTQS